MGEQRKKKDKKVAKKKKAKEKEKKNKKKDKKKEHKKDKKKDKKDTKQAPTVPIVNSAPQTVRELQEKLISQAGPMPVALPGSTPEVKDSSKFLAAKERLESLRAAQQTKEKKVGYSVRKPNW